MRLSTRGRYGTRLMLELASRFGRGPVPLLQISKRQGVSVKYLEQLIIPLKASGLIRSIRGARGGYLLARRPEEISVGEIVEVLEGKLAVVNCVIHPEGCPRADSCPSRSVWIGATALLAKHLYSITLKDILEGAPSSQSPL